MVEETTSAKRPTMRDIKEQFRLERHQEFLVVALRIVTAEGLAGLTMPRLADELDCGIGTLYRHFPSKDALIAELQREALDVISTSFRLSQAHLDELLVERQVTDVPLVALARVAGAVRYWICAERVVPQEIDLLRRMFIDPTLRMDEQEANRVLPASLRLLELARGLLDEAAAAGALHEGPAALRAVVVISGTTGVLMTSALDRWDSDLFHGHDLAAMLARDLFVGWGADPALLDEVDVLLDALDAAGRLVPQVRR